MSENTQVFKGNNALPTSFCSDTARDYEFLKFANEALKIVKTTVHQDPGDVSDEVFEELKENYKKFKDDKDFHIANNRVVDSKARRHMQQVDDFLIEEIVRLEEVS